MADDGKNESLDKAHQQIHEAHDGKLADALHAMATWWESKKRPDTGIGSKPYYRYPRP